MPEKPVAAKRGSMPRRLLLRTVLETEAVGVLFFDNTGILVDSNEAFLRMSGYSRKELKAGELTWRRMTAPEWIAASEEQMTRLQATGRLGPYEKEYLRKDGSGSWILFVGRRLDEDTIVEFCMDISDRKRAEMERELLGHELSHRVKNVFAVVQALATQSNKRGASIEEFLDAFLGRLHAMARAHSMLLDSDWKGADLDALVGTPWSLIAWPVSRSPEVGRSSSHRRRA